VCVIKYINPKKLSAGGIVELDRSSGNGIRTTDPVRRTFVILIRLIYDERGGGELAWEQRD